MTKKNIMPVAVLTAICVIVAALIAAANLITAPIINDRNSAAISESLGAVMPGGQFNPEPDELKEGAPATIKQVYTEKNGKGTVIVLLTNKGYTGKNIGFTVGIDTEGKITGMKVTENGESIVPDMLKPGGSYGENFVGAGADDIADVSTGATVKITEGAIKAALNDAFIYLGVAEIEEEVLPRAEAEVEALARELYGEGGDRLQSSIPEDTTFVKRIYKESGKGAFVAYAFSISRYGTPEFELLISVGEDGKIKAVEKLLWKVSDPNPEYGWYPPADDVIDGFFDSFVGTDESGAPSVDVQTGATNTSTKVRDAVVEALRFAPEKPEGYAPRIIGILALTLSVAAFAAYMIVSKKRRAGK